MAENKTLIIVESPNKIKKISSYLGPQYVIRASFGHVIDLAAGGKHGLGIDIEDNFKPKYVLIPDKKDKLAAIVDAAKNVNQIYLATDPDREGEAIAFHIYEKLKSTNKPIKRITFNSITKSAILEAIKKPGELNKDLFDAQQARRVLDRLVGFMVSPYLINTVGPNLSAGRVQSVAVRLIVDRDREIENFKPEEYWDITAQLAKPSAKSKDSFQAKYAKKVSDSKIAAKIKKDLESDTFKVTKVDAKEKNRNPLPPLTTSKLQQAAAGRFGFPVAKTMRAAQSLYEAGFITYMRTDSTRLAPEFVVAAVDWLQKEHHDLPEKPNYYASKGGAQDAHEAIRPTDVFKTPDAMFTSDDQQKIYRLVWERAVASQMLPAIYDTVSIAVESSSGHELKANGRTLKYSGWLAIASDMVNVKDKNDEDDIKLPLLKVKDDLILVPPKVKADKKETKPPPRFGEGSLVKELEKRSIGRPSTYADIVEKIKYRKYVELKGKTYQSTELGKKIIDILVKHFKFMNYDYTAKMELQLDQIADGKFKYLNMMDDFFDPFQKELKSAYSSEGEDYGINCPKCNSSMKLRHGKFGYFLTCPGYPDCKTTYSCDIVDGKPVVKTNKSSIVEGVECPACKAGMVKRDGKFGPFYACSKYPKCTGKRKVPSGLKCDKCNSDFYWTVFDNVPKLACMGYPDCRNIINPPTNIKTPEWIDPNSLNPKKVKRSVKKVLNASR
jgi:DNA topoisomerase-1